MSTGSSIPPDPLPAAGPTRPHITCDGGSSTDRCRTAVGILRLRGSEPGLRQAQADPEQRPRVGARDSEPGSRHSTFVEPAAAAGARTMQGMLAFGPCVHGARALLRGGRECQRTALEVPWESGLQDGLTPGPPARTRAESGRGRSLRPSRVCGSRWRGRSAAACGRGR